MSANRKEQPYGDSREPVAKRQVLIAVPHESSWTANMETGPGNCPAVHSRPPSGTAKQSLPESDRRWGVEHDFAIDQQGQFAKY